MKRVFNLLIITGIICLAFKSCSIDLFKEEEPDIAFEQLTLSYFEKFTPTGRNFVIYLETIERFPCSNFGIRTQVFDTDNLLKIETLSIVVPDTCINIIGPATHKISLQDVEAYSKPTFLYINEHQHKFRFDISEQKVIFHPINSLGEYLFVPKDTLFRIPDNFVWGYYEPFSQIGSFELDSLLNKFYRVGAIEVKLGDGHYHYFDVVGGSINFRQQTSSLIGFGFKYMGDKTLVELRNIAVENVPGIKITLFDTFGNKTSSNQ